MTPHHLKDNLRANLVGLEALRRNAGANARRYDHILEILRADRFRKASRIDLERGKAAIESLIGKCQKAHNQPTNPTSNHGAT